MSFRYKFSVVLLVLGIIAAIMSFNGKKSSYLPPDDILAELLKGDFLISADELARMLVDQDSGVQIVDIRHPDQYKTACLPGAVNLPLENLLLVENESLFGEGVAKTVFYADDELLSREAWILAMQKGYLNLFVLKGGLAEWNQIVMDSEFTGEKITAQENALFEKRYKARRLYAQWNAMPDSLKTGFFELKRVKDRELVGGCE